MMEIEHNRKTEVRDLVEGLGMVTVRLVEVQDYVGLRLFSEHDEIELDVKGTSVRLVVDCASAILRAAANGH